jgi:chromosome segregation ATPase
LQDKVRNLEVALAHLEALSAARIDEVVAITQKELDSVRAERDAAQASMVSLQADAEMGAQLMKQLAGFRALEELCKSDVSKLQHKVQVLQETHAVLQTSLERSRQRESALEKELLLLRSQLLGHEGAGAAGAGCSSETTDAVGAAAAADGSSNKNSSGSSGSGADSGAVDACQKLVEQSQQRVEDVERELNDARSNINDLIAEIETVASEGDQARTQSSALVQRIAECQNMQRVALEENLRLHSQIDDLKQREEEYTAKYVGCCCLLMVGCWL